MYAGGGSIRCSMPASPEAITAAYAKIRIHVGAGNAALDAQTRPTAHDTEAGGPVVGRPRQCAVGAQLPAWNRLYEFTVGA